MPILSVDSQLISSFSIYVVIVLVKTLIMSGLTGKQRFAKKVFANPEDVKGMMGKAKVEFVDQDVERVRRAHLNDMENIFPFVMLGIVYILSGPRPVLAIWHFRVFAISRILHTVVYLGQVRQPARALAFAGGYAVCLSMAVQIAMHYGFKYI